MSACLHVKCQDETWQNGKKHVSKPPVPIPRVFGREGRTFLFWANYKSTTKKPQFKYILKGFLSSMIADGRERMYVV